MGTFYLLTASPAPGAWGEILSYLRTLQQERGLHPPLGLQIPLGAYPTAFPPDRVDREALRQLPALSLWGPTLQGGKLCLAWKDYSGISFLREIHNQPLPKECNLSPIPLGCLSLSGPPSALRGPELPPTQCFFPKWQLSLYRTYHPNDRPWWEELSYTLMWTLSKGSSPALLAKDVSL